MADDRADEIAREERRRIGRALALLRDRGMDVAAPWEGDLDDLERERYEAIAAALRAYGREMVDAKLELAAIAFDDVQKRNDSEKEKGGEIWRAAYEAGAMVAKGNAAFIRSMKSKPEAQDTP